MARQPGARTQVAFAFESVYGTPPASGYRRMPFATTTLGSEQGLLSPELLGYGRDPQAPIRDAVNVDGDVVIPMDAENLGFWLKAIFGQPTTTGTTPRTHTFQSGGFALPSMAIETQMPDVPRFAMYSGLVADRIQWQSQRSGLLTATVGLIGRGETVAATTAAGTLTDATLPLQRFGNFQGSITRNGAALGNIVSAQVSYANNLDRIETIRNDGLLEGLDPSMAALTGSIEARFADLTLVNQAIAGDPCELVFAWSLGANASLTFTVHAAYLPRPRIPINGPQGVQATFEWQAARATSPAVTFAASVTAIGAASANVTALGLGLGGASPDASNRLSVNAAATLLNNAGGSHEATINKAAAGNDASLALKTGFSARALFGLLGSDDVTLKVSPNGSAFFDAFMIDRATGRAEFPEPLILPGHATMPAVPPAGKLALYGRQRAGAPWLEVVRPTGRDFPLQPHTGLNRIGTWAPSTSTTIVAQGIPLTSVGTISHPALSAASLLTSSRRWRATSAATANSVADQRSALTGCWRGNAAGLGGFTLITRISLTTLQPTGIGFFGLLASVAALATTTVLSALVEAIGMGFERGTHTNWQLVRNDATGAPTLVDLGAGFPVATAGLLTLTIWCPAAGSSIWLRAVNELTGAVFEQEVTTDLPQAATFLAPRLFLNNGATAAAVAFECTGLYLETDF